MAQKSQAYAPNFLTPLNVQKPGPEVGPEVSNIAAEQIPDPLGLVPKGGNDTGLASISGGASKPLPGSGGKKK